MGLGIKNVVCHSGYSYNQYLKDQVASIMENSLDHNAYNAGDLNVDEHGNAADLVLTQENLNKYTRIQGALFDAWGMSGHLTPEKIDAISALEMGTDARTSAYVKPMNKIFRTVQKFENGKSYPVEVKLKDIKRGYYVDEFGKQNHFKKEDVKQVTGTKRKTGIEFVLTQDSSFSYCIPMMNEKDKADAEKILMDCASEAYEELFKQYLKDHAGVQGETGMYSFLHSDARSGSPFFHIHLIVPNFIKLPNGEIHAIEIEEIKQRDFHKKLDHMYKSKLVAKWNARFENFQAEAYDNDNQQINEMSMAEIKDWRVAFTDESLEKIRLNSKAKDMIDKVISEQKVDLHKKFNSQKMTIENEIKSIDKQTVSLDTKKPYGKLVAHGSAPYKFDAKEKESYFVTLEDSNGKQRTIWGVELKAAIRPTTLIGDHVEIENLGKKPVNVKIPEKDKSGKIVAWKEITTHRNEWKVENVADRTNAIQSNADLLNRKMDLESQLVQMNKSYENQVKHLTSTKHRAAVWTEIKQPKKNVGKEYKDLELAVGVAQLNLQLKHRDDVGIAFRGKTDDQLLESVTNTSPFFSEGNLIMELSKTAGMGSKAQDLAKAKIQEWLAKGVLASNGMNDKGQEQFTTYELMQTEYRNVQRMRQLCTQKWVSRALPTIEKEIQAIITTSKHAPEQEQLEFIRAIFDPKAATLAIGVPGAGKTFAVAHATNIANRHGYMTYGIAPTGKVSAALGDETAVNHSMTVDKLLLDVEAGKVQLNSNCILFLDEASLLGTRQWKKLHNSLNGAKIVALGDTNQISSVAVGNTLKEYARDDIIKGQIKYLTTIRRQKDEISLEVANTTSLASIYRDGDVEGTKKAGTHISSAFEILERSERVKREYVTMSEKIEALADDYLNNANPFKEKLILSSENKMIDRVNNVIQDKRLIKGEIGGNYLENHKERFYVGDRIVIEKNNNKEGYKNGDFGTVKAIVDGKIVVALDNGKEKTLGNTRKLRLSYNVSIIKSQGMTVNDTFLNMEPSQVNNQEIFNVGATRNRFNLMLYSIQSEYEEIKTQFMSESKKGSLVDLYNTHFKEPVSQAQVKQAKVEQTTTAAQELKSTIAAIESNQSWLSNAMAKFKAKIQEGVKKAFVKADELPTFLKHKVATEQSQQIEKQVQVKEIVKQPEIAKQTRVKKDVDLSM